ncbi:MAG TPA: S-layer protein domain-containing protein [Methanotrichaceae archaeon]|nr:S-layer protein domain-containing protein [Methanotrichaceae archaeon]
MNCFRVSGVCLLLISIVAALSMGGLAYTPNDSASQDMLLNGSGPGPAENLSLNANPNDLTSGNNHYTYQKGLESAPAASRPASDVKLTLQSDNSTNSTSNDGASAPDNSSATQQAEAKSSSEPSNVTSSQSAAEPANTTQNESATASTLAQATSAAEVKDASANVTGENNTSAVQAASQVNVTEVPATNITSIAAASETNVTSQSNTTTPANSTAASAIPSVTIGNSTNVTSQNVTTSNATAQNVTTNVVAGNATANNATSNVTAENATANATAASEVSAPENELAGEPTPEVESAEPSSSQKAEASGDRIWSESRNSPQDFTWDPTTFAGFFYDIDDNVGTEKLTIHLTKSGSGYSRSVDANDLKYSTTVQGIDYKFSDWGRYQVLGFMADKYFAGYAGTESGVADNDISLINENQLRKVLIDSDDSRSITTGSVLPLANGYELRIKEIDTDGNKVWLALAKDGKEIDSKVVQPLDLKSATYEYKEDIGGSKDTPLILAHVSNVFTSAESSLVTIDGLFQIADDYLSVNDGDKYGKMKVNSISEDGIDMENEDSFTLQKGKIVSLMGNVSFQVADADVLRFAPQVTRAGSYEVRGTVVNPALFSEFTWTPYNFEGFYYDIDDDVGTETLTAKFTGSSIDDGDLTYETRPQAVRFEYEDFGTYDVVGFMADKYFAGYNNTIFADDFSAINEGQLRKVLTDSDDEQTLTTGSVLPLQEGYELRIKEVDINGNKVWIAIAKDGKEVDSLVVSPSSDQIKASTFMYKTTVGSQKNVPILAAHINNVFRGTEADLATIDGLFQLSDSAESVDAGETFDKMKIDSVSDQAITATNDGAISLGRGRNIPIMGNIRFQVADSNNKTFAPVAEKIGENAQLNLSIPEAATNKVVKISVQSAGEAISGASVLVDGQNVGVTGADGAIDYTPSQSGTYAVTANKEGYLGANGTIVVDSVLKSELLMINVPGEVLKGESFLITVNGGVNQTAIEGADVSFDESAIGTTNEQGTVTYASNITGEHTIRATKDGYQPATRNITVSSAIRLTGLNVTEKASAGQNMDVKATLQNAGTTSDSKTLELKVNGKTVATKDVSLEPGENKTVTFQYKPADPGVYRFDVEDRSQTVTVEKASSNAALIAVILMLIIVAGAGFYLYRTGELDKLRGRIKR